MADTLTVEPGAPAQRAPRRTRRGLNERKEGWTALLFLAPNGFGFFAFSAIPIVAALVLSFFDWDLLFGAKFNGVENYRQLIMADDVFRAALLNTVYFVVVSVPVTVVAGLGAAILVNLPLRGM